MFEPIETITLDNGNVVKIYSDDDGDNSPRDWDNLGTIVGWHRRYDLGDEQPRSNPSDWMRDLACSLDDTLESRLEYWEDGNGWMSIQNKADKQANGDWRAAWKIAEPQIERRVQDAIDKAIDKFCIILPVFAYEHGGITLNTRGYSCPWDSGQVGYIYVSMADVRKEYGCKRISAKTRELAENVLKQEVATYDQYLTGDVYGYVVEDENGEDIDSCWGFYGYEYCKQEAIAAASQ